jgi:hypothetical protein
MNSQGMKEVLDATLDLGAVQPIEGLPNGHFAVAVPKGFELRDFTKDLDTRAERLAKGPRRIEGTETAETLGSFVALVNRHGSTHTVTFAKGGGAPTMTAVVDYHEASDGASGPQSAWRGQKVHYPFPFSPQFKAWSDGKMRSKLDFVAFVEDRIGEFLDPEDLPTPPAPTPENLTLRRTLLQDVHEGVLRARGVPRAERANRPYDQVFAGPAKLLSDARTLKGVSTTAVDEVEHALGTVEIRYTKTDAAVKSTGEAKISEYYALEIEVFPGSDRLIVPVRLRANVVNGSLSLGFELIGIDRVIDAAFLDAVQRVETETGRPVYRAELAK